MTRWRFTTFPSPRWLGSHRRLPGIKDRSSWGALGTKSIKWNFTKFLLAKDGTVVDRFAPTVKPEQLEPAIEGLCLSEPQP